MRWCALFSALITLASTAALAGDVPTKAYLYTFVAEPEPPTAVIAIFFQLQSNLFKRKDGTPASVGYPVIRYCPGTLDEIKADPGKLKACFRERAPKNGESIATGRFADCDSFVAQYSLADQPKPLLLKGSRDISQLIQSTVIEFSPDASDHLKYRQISLEVPYDGGKPTVSELDTDYRLAGEYDLTLPQASVPSLFTYECPRKP